MSTPTIPISKAVGPSGTLIAGVCIFPNSENLMDSSFFIYLFPMFRYLFPMFRHVDRAKSPLMGRQSFGSDLARFGDSVANDSVAFLDPVFPAVRIAKS